MSEQEEEIVGRLDISPILGQILSMMPVPVSPQGHGATWQLAPWEDEAGKKSVTAVLGLTRGNGLEIYWFNLDDMTQFVQQSQNVLNVMMVETQKLNPLLIATPEQMQQAVNNKNHLDRKIQWP